MPFFDKVNTKLSLWSTNMIINKISRSFTKKIEIYYFDYLHEIMNYHRL